MGLAELLKSTPQDLSIEPMTHIIIYMVILMHAMTMSCLSMLYLDCMHVFLCYSLLDNSMLLLDYIMSGFDAIAFCSTLYILFISHVQTSHLPTATLQLSPFRTMHVAAMLYCQ